MFFKKSNLDAAVLQKEHSTKVIKCASKIAKESILEIEKGIIESHNKGLECWCMDSYENIHIRSNIVHQQYEVNKAIIKFITEYFENKNFKVELQGDFPFWNSLWIKW
jgi:O-phosphoseryl-tRNA(Cys) synthetase